MIFSPKVKHPRIVKEIRNPTSQIWQGANGATETGTLPKDKLTINLCRTTLRSSVIKNVMEKIGLLISGVKHPSLLKILGILLLRIGKGEMVLLRQGHFLRVK